MKKSTISETFNAMAKAASGRWDGVDAVAYVEDIRGRRRPVTEPVNETLDEGEKLVFLSPAARVTIERREQEHLAWWC